MDIRNFAIIAHVDHGKSTLADRFLELTKSVEERKMQEQYLDRMDLERERGITIQMQPVRMQTENGIILNLVDTPGHVDFSYEVSRALAAVEGAVLLIDATKGAQAQTIAHLSIAKQLGIKIVPVINKVDAPLAMPEEVSKEVQELLDVTEDEIFFISAKTGKGVKELLEGVERLIPAPKQEVNKPLRALIFGSSYDPYKGIMAYVRVYEGSMKELGNVKFIGTKASGEVKELGYFMPDMVGAKELSAGDIGYVATGLKDPNEVRVGDTIAVDFDTESLGGFKIPKPVVFMSYYPEDASDFDNLQAALGKLWLNDPSLTFEVEAKEALGRGFRCGFLGILHSEIISERILREFGVHTIISRPSVEYRIRKTDDEEIVARTPSDWPERGEIESIQEPWAMLDVITPTEFLSQVIQLLETADATEGDVVMVGDRSVNLKYEAPLRGVITDLYDKLKSVSKGMASMDYELLGWRPADVVKLEVFVAGRPEETLAAIVPRSKAFQEGRAVVAKLKEELPAQQFEVALQAVIEGKVIARETIRARRRDVTGALYGGDVTRKRKLLDRQKKGKKELKEKGAGRVSIPSDVLLKIFRG